MDFFETVSQRHSYRGSFQDKPVPREDLRKIVEAGLLAPSGNNFQTTSFIIVDDPALVAAIATMHAQGKTVSVQNSALAEAKNFVGAMQEAKAYIVCVIDQITALSDGPAFPVEDCAAATENMLLAITALGYASVWVDGWLRREGRADKIGQLLGIPENKVARVILPIGVPALAEFRSPDKKPFEERVSFNRS
ncbi:TPA: nitroreductase [Candidatus Sumerlaeota bacterium]|jgi:nitroreductase|nr:nitroreductase [Candidatus Sumerlaeota bacterium]